MLTNYRRHLKKCPHKAKGRPYRRCNCPIWVDGTLRGEEIRRSLATRNWEESIELIRKLETGDPTLPEKGSEPISLATAGAEFLADLVRRNLAAATICKYELLFRQIDVFAATKGLRYLKELDLAMLRQFYDSWTQGHNTALKKLERLRAFFRFAIESKWVDDNPARKIRNPKVRHRPTLPFTRDEMVRIYAACDKYPDCYGRTGQWNARRLRALIYLLRHSGLRIGDAVTLARDRVTGDKLFLYTAKTNTPVYCPLPEFVIDALAGLESENRKYFFWTGESAKDGAARDYMRYLNRLFKLADVHDGHAHRFRDTFATELLLNNIPLERVSMLLGHSSIRVTEKHYSPWVKARQEQLEDDVRRSWAHDPEVLASTKGTQKVHEIQEVVN